MIDATISFPNTEQLQALFATEQLTFHHKRASYSIKNNKKLHITITAQDATALRATVSSICRVLAVNEKAQ